MLDPRDAIRETLEWTAGVVASTAPSSYGEPTPCSEWDVRALLNHLVGGNLMYAMALEGAPPDVALLRSDHFVETATATYDRTAARAARGWASADPAATLVLPYGEMPATFSIGTHQMDHLLHGWDLLAATRRPRRAPAHLVDFARATVESLPAEIAAAPGVFAPSTSVPSGANAFDVLATRCGRVVPPGPAPGLAEEVH